jgi:hypothetical protein
MMRRCISGALALVAESPFRDVVYEESAMSAIVPEIHEERTEPEEKGVHKKSSATCPTKQTRVG